MRVSRSPTPACHPRIRVDVGCASQLVAERRLCKAERKLVRGPNPVGCCKWMESDLMTVCRSRWIGYDHRGMVCTSSTQHHPGRRIPQDDGEVWRDPCRTRLTDPLQCLITQFFTGQMLFLMPKQQHQSTKSSLIDNKTQNTQCMLTSFQQAVSPVDCYPFQLASWHHCPDQQTCTGTEQSCVVH